VTWGHIAVKSQNQPTILVALVQGPSRSEASSESPRWISQGWDELSGLSLPIRLLPSAGLSIRLTTAYTSDPLPSCPLTPSSLTQHTDHPSLLILLPNPDYLPALRGHQ
jgi:hypothetical protein